MFWYMKIKIMSLYFVRSTSRELSSECFLNICINIINLWFDKELNIGNTAWLQIASWVHVGMWRWFCNWHQVLNFQHSTSSNGKLASSIFFDNTAWNVGSCGTKELVLVPTTPKKIIRDMTCELVLLMKLTQNCYLCDSWWSQWNAVNRSVFA